MQCRCRLGSLANWSANAGNQPLTLAPPIPAASVANADETSEMRLSREFHALHVNRLRTATGLRADAADRVSCSTCHVSFDPVDRETPRQTCGYCHNGLLDKAAGGQIIAPDEANCVSCHVQHPFGQNRWSGFLTAPALAVRRSAIDAQIDRLSTR